MTVDADIRTGQRVEELLVAVRLAELGQKLFVSAHVAHIRVFS